MVVSPLHVNGIKRVKNSDEIIEQFKSIAEKNDLPFMNYNLDSVSYGDKYFADFYHMKKEGADVFTKKFAGDFMLLQTKN